MSVEAPTDPAAAVDARGASLGRPLVIALVGLCLVVVAILVWAIFGRAPQTVSGFGYVVPQGGYTEVGTKVTGLVESVKVEPGQRVRVGEELVRVNIADGDDRVALEPLLADDGDRRGGGARAERRTGTSARDDSD